MSVTSLESSTIQSSVNQKDEEANTFFEMNAAEAMEKISSKLLDLSYTLSLESFLPFWFVMFTMVLEFMQQLDVIFPSEGIPPPIPWGISYTDWIRGWTEFISRGLFTAIFGTSASYAAIGLVLALYSGAGFISFVLSRGETPNIILIRIIAIAAKLMTTTLYIPIMELLVDLIDSGSVAFLICGTVFAILHVFAAALTTAAINDIQMLSDDPTARIHCRFQAMSLIFNTVLVISASLFQNFLGIFVLINTAGAIYVASSYTKYCPFNADILNYIQCGLSWTYAWSMAAAFVSVVQNDSGTSGPTFIVYGGAPIVFVAGALAGQLRLKAINARPDTDIGNPYEIERKARLILRKGFRTSFIDKSNVSKKLDEDSDDKLQAEALNRVRRILQHAMIVYPESSLLPLLSGLLYFNFFKINFVGYDYLRQAERIELAFDMRILLFRLQRDNERKILLDEANRDVVEFNRYNELLSKAQDYDLSLTKALVSFWDELSEKTPDIKLLRNLSVTVSQDSVQALTLYQQALKIHGDSAYVLKTYAGLLSCLLQDSVESNRLLARTKEIEMRRKSSSGRKEDTFRSVLFSDHSSVIVMSGSGSNLGKILSVNAFAPQMFGIPESNLVGANVSSLMPEPFSSWHDEIVRRNLTLGKNAAINQRRNVPILHHSGYILDTVLHVKLFIRDLTTLCMIGVFEVVSEDQIQLVVDSKRVVRAVSFTAVQQFGLRQTDVNNNLLSADTLFTDYPAKRSIIFSNKSRDRQWTEIVQVIGETRYRFNISMDCHMLSGAEYADVMRIAILEQESASNPDNWSSASAHLEERIGPLSNVRRRIAVVHKSESVADSSVPDPEIARKAADNRSRQTGSAPTYSESSRSSGASSSQQYEIAKRRDQITVSWLRRSIQISLVLINILALSNYIFTNNLGNDFMELIDEQRQNMERELHIVTIALLSSKLELLQEGLIHDQTENDLRTQLNTAAAALYSINEAQISSWQSTTMDVTQIYVSSLSNSTATSLQDVMAAFSSKAEQIIELPLASITDNNDLVQFVGSFVLQVLDKITYIMSIVDQEISVQLSQHKLLLLMVAVISFILIACLCMYELRPAVDNIFMHSTLVFLRFFDIPAECISTTLDPLVNRLKSLSQSGDQTTVGNVALMSLEARIAFDENDAVKRANKAKAERSRHNRIRNVVLANQSKMVADSGLISKVFVMIFIYLVYFSVNTVLEIQFTSNQDMFNFAIQRVGRVHMQQRRALLVLEEYVRDPHKLSYDNVQTDFSNFFNTFDAILFGDSTSSGIYTNSLYNSILFGNLCGIITANDCTTFASGSSTLGLQMLVKTYRTALTEALRNFQDSFQSLPDPNSQPALSALTTSTLTSDVFQRLWRADNEFLYPALRSLAAMRLQDITDQTTTIGDVAIILLVGIFITNFLVYVAFCLPFLQRLVREFEHCRVLLRLIPNTLRAVKINNDDGDSPENEDGTQLAQVDQQDGEANRTKRQPIIFLKMQRSIAAIYGCAARRRTLALLVIASASLLLWSRFFDFSTARQLYAQEYPTAVVVTIGAFISASTATASMPLGPAFYAVFHSSAAFTISETLLFGSVTELITRSVAVLYMIAIGFTVDWKMVALGAVSSMIGSSVGQLLRYEQIILDYQVTLLCVSSLMCGIGIAIAVCTTAFGDSPFTSLNFDGSVKVDVIVLAVFAGLINALVGFGLAAIMFGLVTLYFRLSSQIATSTAIMIGCLNSVFNMVINFTVANGLKSRLWPLLLALWPFLVLGGSAGTFAFCRMSATTVRHAFYTALVIRFFLVIILYSASSSIFIFIMVSSAVMITAIFVVLGVGGYIRTVSTTN